MITQSSIQEGDRVAVVAPSGCVDAEKTADGIDLLRRWGLEPVPGKHLWDRYGSFAGDDNARLSDLAGFLEDASIKAVFAARGGYGAARLLPALSRITPSHPKWLIGFSDITALHSFSQSIWRWKTIHGPLLSGYRPHSPFSETDFESLRRILFGLEVSCRFPVHEKSRLAALSGEFTGGNLSVLYSLRGTPYEQNPLGKILLLEDVGEYDYHLDRMLTNLRLGGYFSRLRALVVGEFSEMKEGNTPFGKNIQEMILEALEGTKVPVFFGFPSGHGENNHPVILGSRGYFSIQGSSVLFSQPGRD